METLVGRLKVFGCYLASPETVGYPIGPIRSKVRGLEGTVFFITNHATGYFVLFS